MAARTSTLILGTGVTCPIIRTHPAVIAQAAATTAASAGDRFWLGLGTGERLNEHVVGAQWPPVDVRQEMLEEAVDVIRQLWTGDEVDHHGQHFDVENARVYTRPSKPPPIMVAASGPDRCERSWADRRRPHLDFAGSRARREVPVGDDGQGQARGSASSRSAGRSPRRKRVHGPAVVAERGTPRTASQELARPEDFEDLTQRRHRGPGRQRSSCCGPDPQKYLAAVESSRRPASTTCTSTRSDPTRRASSTSPRPTCFSHTYRSIKGLPAGGPFRCELRSSAAGAHRASQHAPTEQDRHRSDRPRAVIALHVRRLAEQHHVLKLADRVCHRDEAG